jgi:FkbM family methyltransferase
MEEPLDVKRARLLALAADLPERCRLVEASEGNSILRKLRKLALFRGRYVRWAAARAGLKPGIVELPLFWGGALTLPYSDEADFVTFYLAGAPGGPEYKLVRHFIRTLTPDDSFYDAGANYGFYTMLAAEFIGARGEIHAFEPVPGIHTRLALNAPAGARVVDAALWDRTGTATLYHHRLGDVFNTLEAEVAETDGGKRATTEVRCTTLDDYAKAHRAPTVIKIDIEGGERRLIAGGLETLRKARPRIAMEVWAGAAGERFSLPACRALLDLGYAAYALDEDGATRALDAAALPAFIKGLPEAWDNLVFLPV